MTVYFDGSPSSSSTTVAVVLCENGQRRTFIDHFDQPLTNNQAEYLALIYALALLSSKGIKENVVVRGDSQLVIYQMNGIYKVREEKLKILHETAKRYLERFKNIKLEWIPRRQNLAGRVLEQKIFNTDRFVAGIIFESKRR